MPKIKSIVILILLLPLISIAYSRTHSGAADEIRLSVPFLSQVPPGDWKKTNNCGQACVLMVMGFYNHTVPTEKDIKAVDDWSLNQLGDSVNGYNGAETNVAKLAVIARQYGGFSNAASYSKWTLDDLRKELSKGHPVIFATWTDMLVGAPHRKHLMLLTGMDEHSVYVNDPGKTAGRNKSYPIGQFLEAWHNQNNAVVVIPPTSDSPSTPPPRKHRVEIRVTQADDVASCYVNGNLVKQVKYGEPDGNHHIGYGDWFDVSALMQPDRPNQIRFTLWNAPECCAWQGLFQIREDGRIVYDRHPFREGDSSEGIKFDDTFSYESEDKSQPRDSRVRTYDFELDSAHPFWTPTGIRVQPGERIEFHADGRIVWDPSVPVVGPEGATFTPNQQVGMPEQFLLRDAPCASLIGKINNQIFVIGADSVKYAETTGELYLGINERWVAGSYNDNRGTFHVSIRIERQ